MTILQFLLLVSGLAILGASGVIAWLSLRLRRARASAQPAALAIADADIDTITRRIAEGLSATHDTGLDTISGKIDQLRAEFDWVVGESLIHQAVSLARTGHSEGEIAQATGISADELDAIRRFRRH